MTRLRQCLSAVLLGLYFSSSAVESAAIESISWDIVVVQDVSDGMQEGLRQVRSTFPFLASTVHTYYPNSRFGVASFIDKPVAPLGSAGDFCLRLDSPLRPHADVSKVQASLDRLVVGGGNDWKEGALDALYRSVVSKTVEWRPKSSDRPEHPVVRVAVVVTDAFPHVGGDAAKLVEDKKAAEVFKKGVLTPLALQNDTDAACATTEYVPTKTVGKALKEAGVVPVFVVGAAVYQVNGRYWVYPEAREGDSRHGIASMVEKYRALLREMELEDVGKVLCAGAELRLFDSTIYTALDEVRRDACDGRCNEEALWTKAFRGAAPQLPNSNVRVRSPAVLPKEFLEDVTVKENPEHADGEQEGSMFTRHAVLVGAASAGMGIVLLSVGAVLISRRKGNGDSDETPSTTRSRGLERFLSPSSRRVKTAPVLMIGETFAMEYPYVPEDEEESSAGDLSPVKSEDAAAPSVRHAQSKTGNSITMEMFL